MYDEGGTNEILEEIKDIVKNINDIFKKHMEQGKSYGISDKW